MRHVEPAGVVVGGAVVPGRVLDAVWWVEERRAEHWVTGEPERPQPPIDRAAGPRRVGGAAEQVGDPRQTVWLVAQDPLEHGGRALFPGLEDVVAAGDLPAGRDHRDDHLGVEDRECARHDLAGDLAHAGPTAGEIRLQLGAGHPSWLTGLGSNPNAS